MKNLLIALALGLFIATTPSQAKEQSHQQTAEKLLDMMNMEQTLNRAIDQMLNIQLQRNPAMAPYKTIMLSFLNKYMGYEVVKSEVAGIYTESFSQKELNEIIAFYETPVGKKSVELMPELMNKGAQIGMTRVQNNMGELQQMIMEEAKRLQELDALK